MRAGAVHHVGQDPGIVQRGAGPQVVVVERLLLVVGHEDGRAQRVQKRHVADVRVRVVGEHTGLHVAGRIDVQVAPATGDATTHELAIVLEVQGEDGLGLAYATVEAVEALAVFGRGHEGGRSVLAHRPVGEDPSEQRALLDKPVEVLVACHGRRVVVGVANGNAKGQPMAVQQIHGSFHLGVGTLAPAPIGGGLVALGRDGRDKVLDANHLLTELLVDERGVGEA